jgi:hypothetical protein
MLFELHLCVHRFRPKAWHRLASVVLWVDLPAWLASFLKGRLFYWFLQVQAWHRTMNFFWMNPASLQKWIPLRPFPHAPDGYQMPSFFFLMRLELIQKGTPFYLLQQGQLESRLQNSFSMSLPSSLFRVLEVTLFYIFVQVQLLVTSLFVQLSSVSDQSSPSLHENYPIFCFDKIRPDISFLLELQGCGIQCHQESSRILIA